jgi:GT2 family glycosyltransferase
MIDSPPYPQKLPPSSLIICTRNRYELLVDLLQSIINAEVLPNELIVVDQSEEPETILVKINTSRECQIRQICIKEIGSSVARNYGAYVAKYDILAFIDDDMIVTPSWYQSLIQTLIYSGNNSIVTGRIEPAPTDRPQGFVLAVHTWKESKVYRGRMGMDILASGLMAIFRSAYQSIGGFDEKLGPGTYFPGAEDNDFGFRSLEAGYKIVYAADAVVHHRAWRNKRDYIPLLWSYGKGQGAFYAKHCSWKDLYMLSRFQKDVSRFVHLLPERLLQRKLLVILGGTAFILGEINGAFLWKVKHGKVMS